MPSKILTAHRTRGIQSENDVLLLSLANCSEFLSSAFFVVGCSFVIMQQVVDISHDLVLVELTIFRDLVSDSRLVLVSHVVHNSVVAPGVKPLIIANDGFNTVRQFQMIFKISFMRELINVALVVAAENV